MKVKPTIILSPRRSHCYYFSMVFSGPYCMHTLKKHNMYHSILTHLRLLILFTLLGQARLSFSLLSSSNCSSCVKHSQPKSLTFYNINFTHISSPIILTIILIVFIHVPRFILTVFTPHFFAVYFAENVKIIFMVLL